MLYNIKRIQKLKKIAEDAGESFCDLFCDFSKMERAEEILTTFPKIKKVSISEDGTVYIDTKRYTYVSTLRGQNDFILVSQKGEIYK